MFEQAFRNIDDVLRKEAGCTTELDYTEQTSWLLFLKYLDGLEQDRADEAKLEGKRYSFILDKDFRWESWAAPKGKDGKLDHNKAMTGDDLREFVNLKLFPYLHSFKQRATGPNTIEYKIGEIFGEIKNKIQSGYNLREIIDHIDELRFRSQIEKHELSHLYEAKIKNMGNAGRNGGEYYTPRPLIRAMVQVVKPKIGEKIYDGACGSAGFLCEAFVYLKATEGVDAADPSFAEHWQKLGTLGIPRGAYHFYVTEDDPEQQARFFLSVASTTAADLPPVVDVETLGHDTTGPLAPGLRRYLDVIERETGRTPVIYTGSRFWNANFDGTFARYPLWVAEYGVTEPTLPSGWTEWLLWQFQGDAPVPGVEKSADRSRLRGGVPVQSLRTPKASAER